MKCLKCGAEMPKGSAFCPYCGANVEVTKLYSHCPKCGNDLLPNSKFCNKCGYKFEETPIIDDDDRDDFDRIIVKTAPSDMNDCIDLYRSFGYQYVSNQMVFSHAEKVSTNFWMKVSSETIITEFVSLSFKRERKMSHYQELKDIENKYFALYSKLKELTPSKFAIRQSKQNMLVLISVFGIMDIAVIVISFIFSQIWSIILGFSLLILVPIMLALHFNAKKKIQKIEHEKTEMNKELNQLVERGFAIQRNK